MVTNQANIFFFLSGASPFLAIFASQTSTTREANSCQASRLIEEGRHSSPHNSISQNQYNKMKLAIAALLAGSAAAFAPSQQGARSATQLHETKVRVD